MDENITALSLMRLKESLQQAALPADKQLARLKPYDVPFEVADDVSNWCGWALDSADVQLTDEQRLQLAALKMRLNKMSGEHNAELWTDDALRSHPEWEEVRHDAQRLLNLFQWPAAEA